MTIQLNSTMTLQQALQNPQRAERLAIKAHDAVLSYAQLAEQVMRLASELVAHRVERVGLYADNSAAWVVLDLACMQAGVTLVPIPLFFSEQQIQHLLNSAALEYVFSDRVLPQQITSLNQQKVNADIALSCYKNQSAEGSKTENQAPLLPKNTAKITFTSGSTGQAKGVCLSTEHQVQVAKSLVARVGLEDPVHLVALPLSTLLENIAGVYAPLLCGGCLIVPDEASRGFKGSQLVNVEAFLQSLVEAQPNTLITVPELLKVMLNASLQGWKAPKSLKFIAVGGAKVSSLSVHQARQCGLPVYQGYGLSECGSVVSLAQAGDPLGSCGKLLEHVNARLVGNELFISGNVFLGYVGEPSTWYQKEFATGDYVSLDQDQLFVTGRKKLQIINSFGRNISPEWAESLITANPLVHQCMVVGEAQPYCVALVSASSDALNQNMLDAYLAQINLQLPDYAKVRKAILLESPLTFEQGLLTANGRIKREQTANMFTHEIDSLYQRDMDYPHAPNKISHL